MNRVMKISSNYSAWYACVRYFLYILLLWCALFVDVACFYTSTFLLAPFSICLYACALTYASALCVLYTLLSIVNMPVILPIEWIFFVVPLISITVVGLCARYLLFTLWPLPYCLVAMHASIEYLLGIAYPNALILMPRLTISTFLVILIVIKCLSLIMSTHSRRGNRVKGAL